MVGARCTGTLVATLVAGLVGTLDAMRRGAPLGQAWSSGAFVAAVWLVPVLVAEWVVLRRGTGLAGARARIAVPAIAIGSVVLVALRGPLVQRFSDRELVAWLWAATAVALLALAVAVGEPLARRLAAPSESPRRGVAVALAIVGIAVVVGVIFGPPVRGLAADLKL